MRVRVLLALGVAAAAFGACGVAAPAADAAGEATSSRPGLRVWKIHYRAHNGARRAAYVAVPARYGPKRPGVLPLVISPHGRGITGRGNLKIWGRLPARGEFAVVSPDGHGRRLARFSWGYPGQIGDLARMPRIVRRALPWLRVDRERIYAFGGSMGGQETLLLVARYPRLLAGAASFDAVTDFSLQYRSFPQLRCQGLCRQAWDAPIGVGLQSLARVEIGGSPWTARRAYAARSPITFAGAIARSCVPLQLWWSVSDRIVVGSSRQSGRLFERIKRLNPTAPVDAFVGHWIHTRAMRTTSRLPVALARFGLFPPIPADLNFRPHPVELPRFARACRPHAGISRVASP